MSSDYKAHQVGDVVTLVVLENTTAKSTGDVNTSRAYQTNSAITGLPGGTSTSLRQPFIRGKLRETTEGNRRNLRRIQSDYNPGGTSDRTTAQWILEWLRRRDNISSTASTKP